MKLWGTIFGGLIGLMADSYSGFGLIPGALLGLLAGVWLQAILRAEVRRVVMELVAPLGDEMREAIPRKIAEALAGQTVATPSRAKRAQPPESVSATSEPPPPSPVTAEAAILPDPVRYVAPEPAEPAEPGAAERLVAAVRDWFMGGNTIVRVGLVVLFIGLVFLARFAANAGLFPVELRLALVAAVGVALIVVGFNRRTVRPDFGLALQSGGVAVLYLTTFAAAKLLVLPALAAFVLMVLFCALGTALALLQNARGLAFGSFFGGFAVPLLLGGESPTPLPLFGYFTVLNLAILFIAWRRSWRELNLLGFFATFGTAILWGLDRYEARHFVICEVFLAISVLIYLATALLYAHNTPGKLGRTVDSTLLFGPAFAGFGLQAAMVQDSPFGSAWSALAFGAVYVALAWWTVRQKREDLRLLGECLIAIGVGFVTLAIPLALDVKWTSAAWALEGAGAFWVGMRQHRWMVRAFGLLLIAVAAVLLLAGIEANVSAVPLANTAFVGTLLVTAPLLLIAWWLRQPLQHSGSSWARNWASIEDRLGKPLFLAGFVFASIAVVREVTRTLPPLTAGDVPAPVVPYEWQSLGVLIAELALMWLVDRFGRVREWAVASWPGRASLILVAGHFLIQLGMGRHVLLWPDVLLWLVALTLHFDLLRRNDAGLGGNEGRLRGWQQIAHAGGVWLLVAMLADSLQLGIDRAQLWDTSWAGVVFLVACIAVLALLSAWAGRAAATGGTGQRWPLNPHHKVYWWGAAVPLAGLTYLGALGAAALAEGVTAPLPYIPLLNPVDLSVALAVVVLLLWRRRVEAASSAPASAEALSGRGAQAALALLGFVSVNAIWLRTAHHYLGIAWTPEDLLGSPEVQTGFAILWTLMAMALMIFAKRRAIRGVWIAGAALLVLTVAKLLLVDMSSAAGWQRIVTFICVGLLMLVIGYLVPLPPRQGEKEDIQ